MCPWKSTLLYQSCLDLSRAHSAQLVPCMLLLCCCEVHGLKVICLVRSTCLHNSSWSCECVSVHSHVCTSAVPVLWCHSPLMLFRRWAVAARGRHARAFVTAHCLNCGRGLYVFVLCAAGGQSRSTNPGTCAGLLVFLLTVCVAYVRYGRGLHALTMTYCLAGTCQAGDRNSPITKCGIFMVTWAFHHAGAKTSRA